MKRTRIEIFLAILQTLMYNGPLRITHIMRKGNVNYNHLRHYISFGVNNMLINKKGCTYTITPLGILVYKALNRFWLKEKKEH